MSVVHWLVLIIAVVAVLLVYWRARRHRDDDPWKQGGSTEAAGKVLQPDYEKLGQQDSDAGMPMPAAQHQAESSGPGQRAAARQVIVDPGVQAELQAVNSPKTPEIGSDDSQSWDNFSTKRDPQLGLDIGQGAGDRAQRNVAAPPGQEKIIVLHVAAKEGQTFAGPAVHAALQICRLQFGMREVYHRITEINGVPEAVFSIASMVKPGHLDPQLAEGFRTPGLTLFMVMPGPIDASNAFRDMLDTAQRIAARLGGELLDDKRSLLTHQSEQYLHDEIAELQRRWRAQPRRK